MAERKGMYRTELESDGERVRCQVLYGPTGDRLAEFPWEPASATMGIRDQMEHFMEDKEGDRICRLLNEGGESERLALESLVWGGPDREHATGRIQ